MGRKIVDGETVERACLDMGSTRYLVKIEGDGKKVKICQRHDCPVREKCHNAVIVYMRQGRAIRRWVFEDPHPAEFLPEPSLVTELDPEKERRFPIF